MSSVGRPGFPAQASGCGRCGRRRVHPSCLRRRGAATVVSSGASCSRTQASVDVAVAIAVVPIKAIANAFPAPAHPSRRPREGGDPATCASSVPSCPRTRASMDVAFALAVVPRRGNSQSVSCAVAPEVLFFAGPKKRTQKKGPSPTDLQPATGRHARIRRLAILARLRTAALHGRRPFGVSRLAIAAGTAKVKAKADEIAMYGGPLSCPAERHTRPLRHRGPSWPHIPTCLIPLAPQ
jgi:hypothetical protein